MLNIKLSLNNTSAITNQLISKWQQRLYSPKIANVITPKQVVNGKAKAPLFAIDHIDLNQQQVARQALTKVLPHRGNMLLLDYIAWVDEIGSRALAVKQVQHDEFWIDGHFPEQPIMPGVLMIEAGAQLALYLCKQNFSDVKIAKLLRIENVRFRYSVVPGETLLILCNFIEKRQQLYRYALQGLVGRHVAFEAIIVGCPSAG